MPKANKFNFEEALANFAGTLLVILHDRYAIERLATRVLEVRDGEVREAPIPIRVSA